MFAAVVVLPSSGWALVTTHDLRALAAGTATTSDVRSDRNDFAEIVRHVRRGEHRVLVAAHRRHQAEERQLQAPRHVLRRLDRVVHVVEAERPRRPPARGRRASDISHVRRPVGAIGAFGTSAWSTTRTLFARLLLETRSSFSRCSSDS